MCTLAALFQPGSPLPLIVAANRDESLRRPSRPPFVWEGTPRILAPRDEVAGGTWLGLNAQGLFVGITNRHGTAPDPARDSRGLLVREALAHPDAAAAQAALSTLSPARFNAFHLFQADRERAFITWSDGARLHREELGPGLHVLTERSFTADGAAREARVREAWPPDAWPSARSLETLLGLHPSEGHSLIEAPCVHAPAIDYGTRSSMVLRLGRTWSETEWRWAEGPPCRTPFEDLSPWLSSLG